MLRACIVNFRTGIEDVRILPGLIVDLGRKIDAQLRGKDKRKTTSWGL